MKPTHWRTVGYSNTAVTNDLYEAKLCIKEEECGVNFKEEKCAVNLSKKAVTKGELGCQRRGEEG